MRLTLRTMLAWLDDTLDPVEVRQIGQQVNETPFARDLVRRIQQVTRRRRLTVPASTGPEGTDPNIVAEYLDSTLSDDRIAEYEKLCLKSDVHLAEVASVHQILSLLGQRAKVPLEARTRMYHLVRGREVLRPSRPAAAKPTQREPSAVLPAWSTPESRKSGSRVAPAVAAVALIGLLAWSAYLGLRPPSRSRPNGRSETTVAAAPPTKATMAALESTPPQGGNPFGATAPIPADAEADNVAGGVVIPQPELGPERPAAEGNSPDSVEPAEVMVIAESPSEPAKGEESPLPPGMVGKPSEPLGILLRRPSIDTPWERVGEETLLVSGQLLVGIDPYKNRLSLGKGRVELIKDATIIPVESAADTAASLELIQGRALLYGTQAGLPYVVHVGEAMVRIIPPEGRSVGIERLDPVRMPGDEPAEATLLIRVAEGTAKLSSDTATIGVTGPGGIRFGATQGFSEPGAGPLPAWVTEQGTPVVDLEVGHQFAQFFRDDAPPLTGLVEATIDRRPEMRALAIEALGSLGQIPLVVGALNSRGEEQSGKVRLAAIEALRAILARGGDSASALHEELVIVGGTQDWANLVEKLLVGYNPAEARDPETQKDLVKLLEHPDVGVRELALRNLMAITGRGDDLGYDPDSPEGAGLKNWQDLAARGEIRQRAGNPEG